MALVLNDRVKESTTTTGTGTVNLGGAATGFETFVAGVGNSNTTYYCIAGQGTAEFEVGIGTVTDASPDTLSRTTILSSSNSDSAVNFSAGTKDVFCTLPASKTIREVDTALNVPTGTTAQRAGSPAAGDFRYNTTNNKFEGYSTQWNTIGSGTNMDTNIFAGDGSDTTFTLSTAPDTENNLIVFIDGVFQAQNVYSVSGTTLTFATAPANGRVITAYHSTTTVGGSNNTIATMTGDNSDTTLSLPTAPVSENNVFVYFDGVYQSKSNYSISGTTLTFSTAPPTGVLVEAITATNTSITTATQLVDADGDTKVMVEEGSDDDTIRMDIAGTEVLTLTNSAMTLKGTTPTLTIGDAGAEDTKIVFDGNAQDYYIGLDDSADDLIIGKGSTVGTTPAIIIDENLQVGIKQTPTRDLSIHAGDDSSVFAHFTNTDTGTTSSDGVIIGLGSAEDLVINNQESSKNIIFENGGSERMRISSGGNILMGTTTVDTSYRLRLHTGGYHGAFIEDIGNGYSGIVTKPNSSNNIFPMYFLNNAGAGVGYILSDASSTTFSTSVSDIFYKENIKDWNENVLDSFKNIKPSTFTYKSDENKEEIKGYIAQNEVDKFPEAYPINPKDGKRWFNPSGMTVYLMKAIQEQQTIIDNLTARIEDLEA